MDISDGESKPLCPVWWTRDAARNSLPKVTLTAKMVWKAPNYSHSLSNSSGGLLAESQALH